MNDFRALVNRSKHYRVELRCADGSVAKLGTLGQFPVKETPDGARFDLGVSADKTPLWVVIPWNPHGFEWRSSTFDLRVLA